MREELTNLATWTVMLALVTMFVGALTSVVYGDWHHALLVMGKLFAATEQRF